MLRTNWSRGSIWWISLAIADEDVWVFLLQGLTLLRFLINEVQMLRIDVNILRVLRR
jgi:hypothetical protein